MQSIFQYVGMKGMNGQSDPARTADPIRSVDALSALSVCAKSPIFRTPPAPHTSP